MTEPGPAGETGSGKRGKDEAKAESKEAGGPETFALAAVAHELRTSLGAVLGFVQVLEARHAGELSAEAKLLVDRIDEGLRATDELLDGLLRLWQAGQKSLERRPVELDLLAREALSELEPQLEGRDLEVIFGRLPLVEGDPVLLGRVFVNLLSNAIKFTSENELARVEIGSFEQAGVPVIYLRDNGIGFDMALTERLFRPFGRLHRDEAHEGSGLGLALVKRIVERHGGRVWAESAPGKGSSFYFTLPSGR